jgi:hypothetical protein
VLSELVERNSVAQGLACIFAVVLLVVIIPALVIIQDEPLMSVTLFVVANDMIPSLPSLPVLFVVLDNKELEPVMFLIELGEICIRRPPLMIQSVRELLQPTQELIPSEPFVTGIMSISACIAEAEEVIKERNL